MYVLYNGGLIAMKYGRDIYSVTTGKYFKLL